MQCAGGTDSETAQTDNCQEEPTKQWWLDALDEAIDHHDAEGAALAYRVLHGDEEAAELRRHMCEILETDV